jgi:FdhD protein
LVLNRVNPSLAAETASETVSAHIVRYELGNLPQQQSDTLVREEPLEIRVRGKSIAVTMRTPGHDRELAAGFLLSEGLISRRDEIIEIAPCLESDSPENTLNVFLGPSVEIDFARLTRHVFATSSCGLCGKASIESVHQHFSPIGGASALPRASSTASQIFVSAETLIALPARMRAAQQSFSQTGGLHAAAIFDLEGNLLVLREDAGRHNAVDKVLGWGFLENKPPFDSHMLLVSGRASFEIVQKALAARIPIVAAVSAPSSLAVEFARESNQTLIGFLRGETFNIYSHPERIGGILPT